MFTYFSDERMAKWQDFAYSKQVFGLLPAYNRLFSLHCAVLKLTNVNLNVLLT